MTGSQRTAALEQIPSNIEFERRLLGSIFMEPRVLDEISDILAPKDFYRVAHETIYTVLLSMQRRHIPIDVATFLDELEHQKKLEEVGGYEYILPLFNLVLSGDAIRYYADAIVQHATWRHLILAAGEIAKLGYERDPQAVEKAEQVLYQLRRHASTATFHTMAEAMSIYMRELETLYEQRGTLVGVPTGFHDLDKITSGWQKTDFILLGGRPGSGKTAFCMNLAYHAALAGKGVAVFSLEMSEQQLARRMMAMTMKSEKPLSIHELRAGWFEEHDWERIIETHTHLMDLPIYINDISSINISSIRAQLRRLTREHQIDLVMIDYVQLIDPTTTSDSEDRYQNQNREQEVSGISRGLKSLAKEFNLPVIALAQLSRAVEQRTDKHPMLSDLRDSGSLEQDADMVLFVYREDYYAKQSGKQSERPHIADITIAKHRNGETGLVSLHFADGRTRFYDLDRIHELPERER